jgi:hypothetical protein
MKPAQVTQCQPGTNAHQYFLAKKTDTPATPTSCINTDTERCLEINDVTANSGKITCKSCFPNYFLVNGDCLPCTAGCTKCQVSNNAVVCIECPIGS